ncbi:MAG: VWA domain-containing protein [Candidatus Pacearchaeota archaeon]|nr:VWA domain-containing protein [Candidatus Pacearchaeota archaeon]
MELKKRGVFFSIDALISLTIILIVIIIAFPVSKLTIQETDLHRDIINSLSSIKIGEIQGNEIIDGMIAQGRITNLNNSILEQIGEFYVTNLTAAQSLAESILSELETSENIRILYENTLIFQINSTPFEEAKQIYTARQVISGIKEGENITGFSSRAFLTNNLKDKFFYFGGYIGDGNISAIINYNGTINSAKIELSINNDFELLINGISQGIFSKSTGDFIPITHTIPIDDFHPGENILEFKGESIHIAGGFIRMTYESEVQYEQPVRQYLPGITGAINFYDGFYIPGILNSLDINLHVYSTNGTLFLNIGNKTVFREQVAGEQTINLDDSLLSSMLEYQDLIQKTIPLRFGLENTTHSINTSVHIISVFDMSKYMRCSIFQYGPSQNQCNTNGGVWMLPANYSEEGNQYVIDQITGISSGKVGLVGQGSDTGTVLFHPLSNDKNSLLNMAGLLDQESYYNPNNVRLCQGIVHGTNEFIASSTQDAAKEMIVMLAGQISTPPCNLASIDLNGDTVIDSLDDAIQAACDAYNQYGIKVNTIGYGDIVDVDTLSRIAECGGGFFINQPNVTQLLQSYQQLIEQIFIAYSLQTVQTSSNVFNILYPDSYIEFNYTKEQVPYGLIITTENQFVDSSTGYFEIPSDAIPLETKVTSYSGPHWTQFLRINNNLIYNLNNYGNGYIPLGDPYAINIPNSEILSNNEVNITTSLSPSNSSVGSVYNKIIYTIQKNASSFSQQISTMADGCTWTVQFEDYTNLTLNIPQNYEGTKLCYYRENLIDYDQNDAIQTATYNLLRNLDIQPNDLVDTKFTEQSLQVSTTEVTGIPFAWSTDVKVITWR